MEGPPESNYGDQPPLVVPLKPVFVAPAICALAIGSGFSQHHVCRYYDRQYQLGLGSAYAVESTKIPLALN